MENIIVAKSVVKDFDSLRAVDEIDLQVLRGECFGLLGPNGAGKSTCIGMIYGTTRRSSGELRVFGLDPNHSGRDIKKRIGVVTQENALDESLTVRENMTIYAAFIGIPAKLRLPRVDELLEYMNLSHKANSPIQTLSGGMKRRLVFVRALLGRPELLILDEPTTGLDPAVRHLLWNKVKELHKDGTTILLTTHYMHEAEILCSRISIMSQGRVIAQGSPQELITQYAPGFVGMFSPELRDRLLSLATAPGDYQFYEDKSGVYLRTHDIQLLTSLHHSTGIEPLQIRPSNLEDVFLNLTGQELSQND